MNNKEIKNALQFIDTCELIRALFSDKQYKLFTYNQEKDKYVVMCMKSDSNIDKAFINYNTHDMFFIGYNDLIEKAIRNKIDSFNLEYNIKFNPALTDLYKLENASLKELFEFNVCSHKAYLGLDDYKNLCLSTRFNIKNECKNVADMFKTEYIKYIKVNKVK